MNKVATETTPMGVRNQTKTLTGMAMMAALSVIFLLVIPKFPIFPAAPYLVYDMADVPIIMSAFMFGPGAGMLVLTVVSLIQGLLLSPDGLIGALMHIIASGTLVLVSYYVAAKIGKNKGMIIGLICGTVAMAAMMVPLNLIITVHVYGQPQDVVMAALLPAIIPFNLV
ncbi:MAG: ECF transporter S component, partial [Bacillota bacterium]